MCGICGQYHFLSGRPVKEPVIRRMMDAMRHRGPDDEGIHIDRDIGLGFRRLSIIDLEGGHQPMTNERGDVWVVLNGEIYNYRELKVLLEERGHVFRSRADTEVIVHGYEEWGVDLLSRLNGMFGLSVWDVVRKRLVIARDRLGIKLVYYHLDSDGIAFASEMHALRAANNDTRELDPVALYQFLRFRYTPSPLTICKGVMKLAPGTRLVVEGGKASVDRWWNFRPSLLRPIPSFLEAEETLATLYVQAVKRHLLSDVPVGLLLSGGVDSALLLALMKEAGYDPLTLTVGYGPTYRNDELHLAQRTADLLKARNIGVTISQVEFFRDLGDVVKSLEEPIASASIVPMYHVCRRARQELKVAFVGQGPDELLGGYRRHIGVYYGDYWRRLPGWVRRPLKNLLSAVSGSESAMRGSYSLDVKDRLERYVEVFSLAERGEIASLFRPNLLPATADESLLRSWSKLEPLMTETDELGGFQFLELRVSLPDELLMYADKMSMANSLELRVPYLDHTVVEYVERLPASYKMRLGKGKRIHRAVCRRYLPAEILARRKRGFAADIVDDWFRSSLDSSIGAFLKSGDSYIYDYLEPAAVRRLVNEHQRGSRNYYKILFSVAVLEEWLKGS